MGHAGTKGLQKRLTLISRARGLISTYRDSGRGLRRVRTRTWHILAAMVLMIRIADAEQVIVHSPDYSNDEITDGGQVVACVVTLVVLKLPDPRVLNFQFLQFSGGAS